MRSCEEMLELMSAALDGELSAEEAQELHAHLDACPACGSLYAELSGLHLAAEELTEAAPEGFSQRVLARIAENPAQDEPDKMLPFPAKRTRRWKTWAASAAVVALVILGVSRLPLPGGTDSASNGSSGDMIMAAAGGDGPNADLGGSPEAYQESGFDAACDADAGTAVEVPQGGSASNASKAETADANNGRASAFPAEQDEPLTQNGLPAPAEVEPYFGTAGAGNMDGGEVTTSTTGDEGAPPQNTAPPASALDSEPIPAPAPGAASAAVYCGVLVITGEPLPDGLEEYPSTINSAGALEYVVPAEYFYTNAAALEAASATNYFCPEGESAASDAEYGLIIINPLEGN